MKTSLFPLIGFVFLLPDSASGERPAPIPKDTMPAELALTVIPLGLDARPASPDNPLTASKVRLGRQLFFDPILSGDNTIACATCHQPDRGFSGGEARPRGIRGQRMARKAPTLLNRAFGRAFFWDGRETSLEAQALKPIEDPTEMGSRLEEVVGRLQRHAEYPRRFADAFADGITAANVGRALASFERVLLRGDSRVDRFRRLGEASRLDAQERYGLWLYESKARCWRCHSGPNFTDERFHNTGVSWGTQPPDLGRFRVSGMEEDKGKFKTPTLRAVSLTAPYMHDGSLTTLEQVVEFYNRGGGANPHRDSALAPLELSPEETRALIAFLKAL
jgi:cytochrome c peroxidase